MQTAQWERMSVSQKVGTGSRPRERGPAAGEARAEAGLTQGPPELRSQRPSGVCSRCGCTESLYGRRPPHPLPSPGSAVRPPLLAGGGTRRPGLRDPATAEATPDKARAQREATVNAGRPPPLGLLSTRGPGAGMEHGRSPDTRGQGQLERDEGTRKKQRDWISERTTDGA